ncbi:hypothetical protein FOMPIDRAFT_1052671 [Fomitopsis schrenkii]|uniref:Uncharacterized protein n=1 Tax=Fomitopsis schrenkii TaxID=2126942 RepID=S8E129_FOMSC|nr:hypothetical protein FOMPIDRAFT_1052671 [Fomitopsis schrenkii]
MRGSPSIPPTAPEPYTGCPYCTPYLKRQELLEELGFLPPDAVPAMDPDDIDGNMWNDYYWGYSEISRSERSTIIRPLPPSITERIALEIFERIIGFVQYDTSALYNCAVMMRRLRSILEPWDKHGILTVGGYNEDTLPWGEPTYGKYSEQNDAAKDGEEAQSSEDNTIRAWTGEENASDHGLGGAVRDSVGDGEASAAMPLSRRYTLAHAGTLSP